MSTVIAKRNFPIHCNCDYFYTMCLPLVSNNARITIALKIHFIVRIKESVPNEQTNETNWIKSNGFGTQYILYRIVYEE